MLGGFKSNGQLAANPVSLIPDPWVFDNYADVLWGENAPAFWGELFNSVIVAIVAVGVTVGCASAAAFVFARIRFRGREAMYTLFVFGLLFPTAVAILPLYILIRQVGLSGSLLGVALPQAAFGLPLSIVILRPFFRSIPMELEDAARMDGCGSFGFFWRVLLPAVPAGARDRQRAGDRDHLERVHPAAGRPEQRGPVDAAAGRDELLDDVQLGRGADARLHGRLAHPRAGLLPHRRAPHRGRPHGRIGEGLMATIETTLPRPGALGRGARRRPARRG